MVRHELELVCDAAEIPEEIAIDLAGLDIGDSIHISQVTLPEGIGQRDHRPRLHHRHHRRPVRRQVGGGRSRGGRRGAEDSAGRVPLVGEEAAEGEARRRLGSRFMLRWLGHLFGARPVEVPGQPLAAPAIEDWGEFAPVQIWVGLGNPGAQYAMHRHNVGFMAVDAIAEVHGFDPREKGLSGLDPAGPDRRRSASCCSSPPPS